MHDYLISTWHLRSALPLPELLPLTPKGEPDITIHVGKVPESLGELRWNGELLQIGVDGSCRFTAPGIATYLIRGGREIIVDPLAACSDVRVFLLGTVFSLLCHQRGVVALHAACIHIGNKTIAVSGISGAGKSTLAAALWREGACLLGDDHCVVSLVPDAEPMVLPAFPRLRLGPDSAKALGMDLEGLPPVRDGIGKYHLDVAARFLPEPAKLDAVYHLTDAPAAAADAPWVALEGVNTIAALRRAVQRKQAASRMGLDTALFQASLQIVKTVPQYTLHRPSNFADLPGFARLLMAHHGSA